MARAAEQPIDPQVARILTSPKVMIKLGKGVPGFDRAGLLAGIFAALSRKQGMDGQNALAEVMVDELFAAKPGAMSRTRILDSICRLLNWHSDDVHAQPVEEMSEDELRSAIASSLPGLKMAVITRPRKPRKPIGTSRKAQGPRHDDRYRMAVGEEVRIRREARGWKRSDLAMRAGVPKVDIGMLETGKRFLTLIKMARIAEALGVTLGDWQRGQFSPDPMPPPNPYAHVEVIPESEEDLEAGMDEPCEPDL